MKCLVGFYLRIAVLEKGGLVRNSNLRPLEIEFVDIPIPLPQSACSFGARYEEIRGIVVESKQMG